MDSNDCIVFVRRNPTGFLATIDGDRPHVRPMTVWNADASGFYFFTSRVKPLMSQLKELQDENRRLKKMYAEAQLSADLLKEAMSKKW